MCQTSSFLSDALYSGTSNQKNKSAVHGEGRFFAFKQFTTSTIHQAHYHQIEIENNSMLFNIRNY